MSKTACHLTASEGFLDRGEMTTLPDNEKYVNEWGYYLVYSVGQVVDADSGDPVAVLETSGKWDGCWRSVKTGAIFSDVLIVAEKAEGAA